MQEQLDACVEAYEDKGESARVTGVVVGVVAKVEDTGVVLVEFPSNTASRPLPARSIVNIEPKDVGREVVLLFEAGDPERPIVMGFLQNKEAQESTLLNQLLAKAEKPIDVKVDDETLTLTAQKEVVIRCGKASITLTRAGKVLIRGAYLLSRSSGVNRIKGGSVQIN
ncbi:MAG: hypothetical protein CV090_10180 [Nitrospira sp. WS238]|nr:hypothetical protein [Nitrospira sp. WS238]